MPVATLLSLTKRSVVNYIGDLLYPNNPSPPSKVNKSAFSTLGYKERRYVVHSIREILPIMEKEDDQLFIELLLMHNFLELISEELDWILECSLSNNVFVFLLKNHYDNFNKNQCKKIIDRIMKEVNDSDYSMELLLRPLLKYCSTDLDKDQHKQIKDILFGRVPKKDSYFVKLLLKYYSTDLDKDQRKQIKDTLFDYTLIKYDDRYYYDFAIILLKYCSADLSEDQRKQCIDLVIEKGWVRGSAFLLKYCSMDLNEDRKNQCKERIDFHY
jgi:hypothetical protein